MLFLGKSQCGMIKLQHSVEDRQKPRAPDHKVTPLTAKQTKQGNYEVRSFQFVG